MIKMRVAKDKRVTCNACGNDIKKSVEIFDVCLQVPKQNPMILHLCDKCISEMFDKTLKARCLVDGMVKSPQQIRVINGRKQAEIKQREKERKKKDEAKRFAED